MTEQRTTTAVDADDLPAMDDAAFAQVVLGRVRRHALRRRRWLLTTGLGATLLLLLALAFLPATPGRLADTGADEILALLLLVGTCCLGWLATDSDPAGRPAKLDDDRG